MGRLSIEVTEAQHQKIKAMAALSGMTIKNYILQQALPPVTQGSVSEAQAMRELETLLRPRIEEAERGEFSTRSMPDIIRAARARHGA